MISKTLVSLFVPSLRIGGAERVALNLSQALAEKGLKVDLVLQNAIGPFLAEVHPQVRVVDLSSAGILSKLLALTRYLEREQPAILLSILDNINVAGWAQKFARVPTRIIVSLHINLSEQPQGFRTYIKPLLIRCSYCWADGIVAVSRSVAEDLAALSGLPLEKIRVIHNPVVTPLLVEKSKEPVEHPWFALGEPPVILGVGRLAQEKDFSTLIRAFALVRQQRPVRLMLLGEGEQRTQLEELVRTLAIDEAVVLPGFAENPYAYMAKASVFVLSSVTEAFGNVMAEAMAVGTPIVSTNCIGGPPEILEGGKYGRLVPVGDVEQLAQAMIATLNQPINGDVLRERSQAFSVERIVKQYLEIFKLP